jgi:RNA polymerase sigma-70 factor (ECF subfamily)
VNNEIDATAAEFRKRLLGFIRKRVRSDADAEDIVQDVLTKLVTSAPSSEAIHSWLFKVARNSIIDRSRKRTEVQAPAVLNIIAEEPEADAQLEVAKCLCPMISVLSTEDKLALERVDMRGESQTEVALELGISTSGMKSRVQRARNRLRAAVEQCCEVVRDSRGSPAQCEKRSDADCAGNCC